MQVECTEGSNGVHARSWTFSLDDFSDDFLDDRRTRPRMIILTISLMISGHGVQKSLDEIGHLFYEAFYHSESGVSTTITNHLGGALFAIIAHLL